ncbi:hypothetical protein Lesp02_46200 [Lentzea sp. NBRC 105346]|nr:hypothetical protein Lesp02_46200 [Lentzea sp. NBRC 105346]
MGEVRIGTSGWVYPPWRGTFYPKGVTQKKELSYLAGRLNSVEINGSFYSLQTPSSYRKWASETPDDFVFAVKGSRFITHMKRLNDPETVLPNFLASGVLALGPKLGPILWQLPPTFRFDAKKLTNFFDHLPRTTTDAAKIAEDHDERVEDPHTTTDADRPLRHALEIRHDSFRGKEFTKLLKDHDIALVIADAAGKYPLIEEVTSSLVYIRLHGHDELYVSGYTDEGLDMWAKKIRKWSKNHDVHVYFDNDAKVMAPRDALALRQRLS